MPLDKHSRSILYFLVFCVLAVTTVRCQHLRDNFQTMAIGPNTLKVKLDGLLPLIQELGVSASYFGVGEGWFSLVGGTIPLSRK
jgi:hypothetical protein